MSQLVNDKTCRVTFSFDFKSNELRGADFPVEIRTASLVLISRNLASQGADLEAGAYFATVKLPSSVELSRSLFITGPGTAPHDSWAEPDVAQGKVGGTLPVEFEPIPGQESPRESWETTQFLGAWSSNLPSKVSMGSSSFWLAESGTPLGLRPGLRGLTRDDWHRYYVSPDDLHELGRSRPDTPNVSQNRLSWFTGNALTPGRERFGTRSDLPGTLEVGQSLRVAAIPGVDFEPLIMQLIQPHSKPMNVVLPLSPEAPCTVRLEQLSDGQSSLDIRLNHPVADLFLRYIQSSHVEQAEITGKALQAEALLKEKIRDPIAAAVGAYALLRFQREDQLHDWAQNLVSFFPWLADGFAILGEQEARRGSHDSALSLFSEIPQRGLPVFALGLSYAMHRLRIYLDTRLSKKGSPFSSAELQTAETALARLQDFAMFTVFQSSILTFTGLDPTSPDDKPYRDDIKAVGN
jgi:hypothetical protein